MSGPKLQRQLVASFAALLMSTIFIGATVAPSEGYAAAVPVVIHA